MYSDEVRNEKNIFRTWVLDPNNKNFSNVRSLIDRLIINAPSVFKLIQTDQLPNGLEAYKYFIIKPEDPAYYALTQILSDISYDPLIISMPIEAKNNDIDLTAIDQMVKQSVKSILNIEVSFNQIVHYEKYIQFLPHDMNSNRIYTDYDKVGQILESLKSRETGDSYLDYLMADELETDQKYNSNTNGLVKYAGNTESLNFKLISENFDNNNNYILRSECLNNSPELTINLYTEICQLWGFNIVEILNNELIIQRSDKNPIGLEWPLQEWFKTARRAANLGKLIPVTLEGHWQLWDAYKKPLISYAAHRAYIEDNYSFISSLRVNDDYSVTADFDSLQTYINFKSKFMDYLDRHEDWGIIETNGFVDAVIKRYELGTSGDKYRNNKTLIISNDQNFSEDNVYLVTELKLDDYVFVGKRQEFESALRNFLQRCSNIFVSTTKTVDLNSLSLEDMMTIIYSDNNEYNINNSCFSTDVIEKVKNMNLPLEPILSTDENISRYENLFYALSGYFDFGPLRGIYSKPPTREIKIPMGRVEATILEGSEDSFSAVPIVSVDFISSKGSRNLFMIATINVFEVQDLVEILWKDGWFLSDWGIAYYEKTGELSLSLIRDIQFLRIAADTPERGSVALELLKRVANYDFYNSAPKQKLNNQSNNLLN